MTKQTNTEIQKKFGGGGVNIYYFDCINFFIVTIFYASLSLLCFELSLIKLEFNKFKKVGGGGVQKVGEEKMEMEGFEPSTFYILVNKQPETD